MDFTVLICTIIMIICLMLSAIDIYFTIKHTKNTKKIKTSYDYINPVHYKKQGQKECIDVIREKLGDEGAFYFCVGNTIKYDYRKGDKPNEDLSRDIGKITWYKNKAMEIANENHKSEWVDKLQF